MNAIDTLKTEHRLIERVLDALDAYTREVQRRGSGARPEQEGVKSDKQELAGFVTFIREFADRCHHGKEEGILFEELVENGFPSSGPISVMLHDHEAGRALVRTLAGLSEQTAPWSAEDRQQVAAAAQEYTDLLRRHIQKEDTVLYPMAESHLLPEVMKRVGERFERFEEEETGHGEHQRLHALAEELASRHLPGLSHAESAVASADHSCACQGH